MTFESTGSYSRLKISSAICQPCSLGLNVLIRRGRDKTTNILQMKCSNKFYLNENVNIAFLLKFIMGVQLTIIHHWLKYRG